MHEQELQFWYQNKDGYSTHECYQVQHILLKTVEQKLKTFLALVVCFPAWYSPENSFMHLKIIRSRIHVCDYLKVSKQEFSRVSHGQK